MSVIESLQLHAIEKFSHSAEAFCLVIENAEQISARAFARQCAATLATVYADLLALTPAVQPCEETLEVERDDTGKAYSAAHEHLKHLNGYALFFDPYDAESAASTILGDDLADIYAALREGLDLYQLGSDCALQEAAFQWQVDFGHWGRHLVSALTALHQIIAENLLADDEQPNSAE